MIPASLETFTESPEIDIIRGVHIFEPDLEKNLTGCFLGNSIPKAAHCFLGMVDDTCVVRILLFDILRLIDIPKILLLWYGLVCPDDTALGQIPVVCEWKVHSAMADPEKIPVVSIW